MWHARNFHFHCYHQAGLSLLQFPGLSCHVTILYSPRFIYWDWSYGYPHITASPAEVLLLQYCLFHHLRHNQTWTIRDTGILELRAELSLVRYRSGPFAYSGHLEQLWMTSVTCWNPHSSARFSHSISILIHSTADVRIAAKLQAF
jgi:hypothetical protein